jgi:hypothetical protein
MRTKTRNTGQGPLRSRLGAIDEAGATALGALAGRSVRIERGELLIRTGDELLAHIVQPLLLLRHRIVGARGEIGYLLGRREAITFACVGETGIGDEELLRRRLSARLEPGDLDGLEDVAWLLAERGDRVMRRLTGGRCGLAFEAIDALTPETCARLLPATREHAVMRLRMLLEQIPPTDFVAVADPKACDLLDAEQPADELAPARDEEPGPAEPRAEPGGIALHTFLLDDPSVEAARRCSQRLGLDLRRHPGHTAPNPSTIRDGIVLIDVPPGFDQRFDWSRRIKDARPGIAVAILVHHPTRSRVLRAFEARADIVLGWPTDPLELAIRLRKLVAR